MKKKILAMLLAVVMAAGLLPGTAWAADASGTCGANVTWSLSNGVLTIEGTGPMNMYGYYDMDNNYIASPWYDYRDQIHTIVIVNGVTTIGHGAFEECNNLTSVTIPSSVNTIENMAFGRCTSLTSMTIPYGVTYIGSAFYGCSSLTSVTIPNSVTRIVLGAFGGCTALIDVTIPNSLTNIEAGAFNGCTSLTSINVASGNPAYRSVDGVLFNADQTVLHTYPAGKSDSRYSIPASVTSISDWAFDGSSNLTGVTIPDSVTSIGDSAFLSCENLTSVTIPEGVTSIGLQVFRNCGSLTSVTIPEGVTSIGTWAFLDCTSLTSVTIPTSVTTIGNYAFATCDSLTDVYYGGTEDQWAEISIGVFNGPLTGANIIYSSTGPEDEDPAEPTRPAEPTEPTRPAEPEEPEEPAGPEPELPTKFTDVAEDAYYAKSVAWAVEKGITSGIGNDQFGPDNDCTRAQIVTFLWNAYGKPEPTAAENPFTDVKPSDYYYKAVLWAVENKITSGIGNGQFGPGNTCTRAQAATFQYKAAGSPPVSGGSSFTDVPADAYYAKAVAWAAANGITSGIGNGQFGSGSDCTRAQVVTFLYRDPVVGH